MANVHSEHAVEVWKICHGDVQLERRLKDISSQLSVCSSSFLLNKRRIGRYHRDLSRTNSNLLCLNSVLHSTTPLTFYDDINDRPQFISIQSGFGKLRLYDGIEDISSEFKLKSDFIPGVITSMAYLPLNRMFLFGSSNGLVKLVS